VNLSLFDADLFPILDFLFIGYPYFSSLRKGNGATRWTHLNEKYSLIDQASRVALDDFFVWSDSGRNSAAFIIFNWDGRHSGERGCIIDAGNWETIP